MPPQESLLACCYPDCKTVVQGRGSLARHFAIHWKQFIPPVKCQYVQCSRLLSSPTAAVEHYQTIHDKQRALLCAFGCVKAFLKKESLARHHRNFHQEQREFVCTHEGCNRSFVSVAGRLSHHTSEHVEVVNKVQVELLPDERLLLDDNH